MRRQFTAGTSLRCAFLLKTQGEPLIRPFGPPSPEEKAEKASPRGKLSPQATDEGTMKHTANKKLTPFAQSLRKNMTKEERHLWYDFLKQLPVTVHRQKVIGAYIVDFYCHQAKLVIEIDGSQHYEEAGQNNDRRRDEFLRGLGLSVLRFSNHDIHQNFEGVCSSILQRLEPFGQE